MAYFTVNYYMKRNLKLDLKIRKSRLIGAGLLAALLGGCSPKFEVVSSYNEFREIKSCVMKNNQVEAKKDNSSVSLTFDLVTGEKHGVKATQLWIRSSQCGSFQKDSRLILNLETKGQSPKSINLTAFSADSSSINAPIYSPGYMMNGYYQPGTVTNYYSFSAWVSFILSDEELNQILKSDKLSFVLEGGKGEKITGNFSKQNFQNRDEFKKVCGFKN